MRTILLSFALLIIWSSYTPIARAEVDRESMKVAKAVKMYIAKEHRKRKTDPSGDFDKLHKLCGRSQLWTKGCRFWKAKGSKDDYTFQVRKTKKIYGIPSYLLK